jgi:tripartite-type tricarboxylate transporter receptor subunit TctC
MRPVSIFCAAVLALGTAAVTTTHAQEWPVKPVRFVVPVPPGGGLDTLARMIGERMATTLGQPWIVDNRPGAGANVGTEYVVKQPADGYTVLMSAGFLSVNPYLYKNIGYDPIADLQPVSMVATVPLVLVVGPKVPAASVKDLIAHARANPGKLTFASAGMGTAQHLAAELFKSTAAVDLLHVPYKGTGAFMPALLSGEVDAVITPSQGVLALMKAGKVRALGIADARRSSLLPDVPTIAEAGPLPGFDLPSWYGVHVRAGTPRPITERMSREINAFVRSREASQKLEGMGLSPGGAMTPDEFLAYAKTDLALYGRITKAANIKPE